MFGGVVVAGGGLVSVTRAFLRSAVTASLMRDCAAPGSVVAAEGRSGDEGNSGLPVSTACNSGDEGISNRDISPIRSLGDEGTTSMIRNSFADLHNAREERVRFE